MAASQAQIVDESPAGVLDKKRRPGFVEFQQIGGRPQLDDLWFMVGSRCNLACTHCYVDSSPHNDTLEQMTLEDVLPFIEEGVRFGMGHVYYTGGEPFINRDIVRMIEFALRHADTTVLTNATTPIMRRITAMQAIARRARHTLRFRVSLDHYDEEAHDTIRGEGSFRQTLRSVRQLHEAGFESIITATSAVYEGDPVEPEEAASRFRELFRGLPIDVKILPFTLEMGANLRRIESPSDAVFISEDCMEKPGVRPDMFQCHNGRTVQKIEGRMVVYPCPIIYNERQFELASTLTESFHPIYVQHKACYDFCYDCGGSCAD